MNTIYQIFNVESNRSKLVSCIDIRNKESILLLSNPQFLYLPKKNLINDKEVSSINSNISTSQINYISFNNKSIKQNKDYSNEKFDKKNKKRIVLDEDIKIKKEKVLNKKKKHNKIHLDNENILFSNTNLASRFEIDQNDITIFNLSKSKKFKKKQKSKNKHSNLNFNKSFNNNTKNQSTDSYINKVININSHLTIQELALKLNISEASIITWLFLQGISVTINQVVDMSIATKVARHYNFTVSHYSSNQQYSSSKDQDINTDNRSLHTSIKRAPVVTVFGHVDHGKTTLLDCIRKTNLVHHEPGGITQSIKGYEVNLSSGENLILLDTPGHEAFTSMRSRSADVTDIALLLVAADDGLKPQTIEAINYIMSRKIPFIVAINKIDKQFIDLDKITSQLANYKIIDTKWGGENTIIHISALTGMHIDILLSSICRMSNQLNLKTNLNDLADGTVIESYLNIQTGPVAIVIIKNGTLSLGDIIISGNTSGRIKWIIDSYGSKVSTINSSAIVQICGFSELPQAGSKFYAVEDEKIAKNIINNNYDINYIQPTVNILNTRVTLENYNNTLNIKKINIIAKADKQGSLEAILNAFAKIPQNKVQIHMIASSTGSISDTDISLANMSQSFILGFNLNINLNIRSTAQKYNVIIREFNIIYDLLDYVKQCMLDLIIPEYSKVHIGRAIIRNIFCISKGSVAGCFVESGILKKGAYASIYRNHILIHEGLLTSLKRLKENVSEVLAGNECGVMCADYNLWRDSDVIEVFDMVPQEKVL